jgi:endonuclease/exonuclease/phosphatase (EEP) superfamily protein YafD
MPGPPVRGRPPMCGSGTSTKASSLGVNLPVMSGPAKGLEEVRCPWFLVPCRLMTDPLRLMTVNLLHDRGDSSHFASVLTEVDPDIVVTQELGPICAEVLASRYPHHHLRPAPGFLGRGIASKLDASFADIEMPGRPGAEAVVSVGRQSLRIAGTHLLNPIEYPWWDSVRTRRGQLDVLFDWAEAGGDQPVVVAGDFNASPRWPAYRQTTRHLDDLVADWADRVGAKTERTWGWRPGWPRMLRIDHIFGRGIQAHHVRVVPIVGSDHAAVVADLLVADQSPVPRSRSNAS